MKNIKYWISLEEWKNKLQYLCDTIKKGILKTGEDLLKTRIEMIAKALFASAL